MARINIQTRNNEGYSDPTAYEALQNVLNETGERDARAQRLIKSLKEIIEQSGYDLLERIVLQDRKTGRYYR